MEIQDKLVDEMPTPEITTALLDLAQLSHRIELAASEAPGVIAAALLERLVMLCKGERGAVLIPTQSPGEQQPVIWADRHRLRAVLDNLLDNAICYSPEAGAIEITIRPLFAPGHTGVPPAPQGVQQIVELCVQDYGIGIPPAHKGRVFDRFHRVDTRLSREVSGLGLAICKRIVELHGGTIWAESDLGQGSTFHVWLQVGARLFH